MNESKYKIYWVFKFIIKGGILQIALFTILFIILVLFKDFLFSSIQHLVPELDNSMKPLMIPLFTGAFLWQFALMAHKPLEIEEKTGVMLGCIILSLIVNIIGNITYLPEYGLIATIYTMITSAIVYIVSTILFSKFFNTIYVK